MSFAPRTAYKFGSTWRKLLTAATVLAIFAACLFNARTPRVEAQTTAASNIVISQIYTRGGEPGATFRNDYIELFNRGTASVSLNGYTLQMTTREGNITTGTSVAFFTGGFISLAPGQYYLVQFGGSGTDGAALPSPDLVLPFSDFVKLGHDAGKIAIVRNTEQIQPINCGVGVDPDIADYVGYGTTDCSEGGTPAPAPTLTNALVRDADGCADTDNNAADFRLLAIAPRNRTTIATPCGGGPLPFSIIQFGVPQLDVPESQGLAEIPVTRLGNTSGPATVEYLVSGISASERSDFTTSLGTLHFNPGETVKNIPVLITDDALQESNETASAVILNSTGEGAGIGPRNQMLFVIHDNDFGPPASNPVDDAQFFTRQHYHDFLNREPDASGLAFWINQLTECGQSGATCNAEVRRINVSASFFLSIEFQQTGFLVYRIYKAALPASGARPRALPRYQEFVRDTQAIGRGVVVGEAGWEQRLDSNTIAFVEEFVARPEFVAQYPVALTPFEYVERLNTQAGDVLSPAQRETFAVGLLTGQETRASVLRKIAENRTFSARESNRAFVLMQYFGYLRRNPNDAPDLNFVGYDFWLSKLDEFGGNFVNAEMVKAFINSPEYRQRFSQ